MNNILQFPKPEPQFDRMEFMCSCGSTKFNLDVNPEGEIEVYCSECESYHPRFYVEDIDG